MSDYDSPAARRNRDIFALLMDPIFWIGMVFLAFIFMLVFSALRGAHAADGQGAYTQNNSVAQGYQADAQMEAFIAPVATGTLTNLDDPVAKGLDLFQMFDPESASRGTKVNFSITLRAEKAASDTTVWVAYYYHDEDADEYILIALDQPFGDGVMTTENAEVSGTYATKTAVMDSFAATHVAIIATSVESVTEAWLGSF